MNAPVLTSLVALLCAVSAEADGVHSHGRSRQFSPPSTTYGVGQQSQVFSSPVAQGSFSSSSGRPFGSASFGSGSFVGRPSSGSFGGRPSSGSFGGRPSSGSFGGRPSSGSFIGSSSTGSFSSPQSSFSGSVSSGRPLGQSSSSFNTAPSSGSGSFASSSSTSTFLGSSNPPVAILSEQNKPPGTTPGNSDFSYSFEAENGIKQKASGSTVTIGENRVVVMKGSYEYVGPDGLTYVVEWYADETGFHPSGPHLPELPVVPTGPIQPGISSSTFNGGFQGGNGGSSFVVSGSNGGFSSQPFGNQVFASSPIVSSPPISGYGI